MKYIKSLLLSFTLYLLLLQPTFAQCTYMGEEIPCDQMPIWVWILFTGMCIFGLISTVFWIWMLIDAIQNNSDKQLLWIIVIIFTGWIGALIYFFMGRNRIPSDTTTTSNPIEIQEN